MNAKTVTCAVLVALWGACAVAHGQSGAPVPGAEPPPIKATPSALDNLPTSPVLPVGAGPPPGTAPSGFTGLSDWITYRRPDCCSAGPLMPIFSELYVRVGPSVPVGGTYTGRELIVGWTFEAGVRAMFFDPGMTSAWIIDAGIVNTNNGAVSPGTPVVLTVNQAGPAPAFTPTSSPVAVTMRNYNRTFASLGFGKDWYLWEPANSPGPKWRIGVDGGGRYGASDMTYNEIRHRTRTIEGAYVAAHTEYEIPCGCCVISWGLRCEWAHTWDNVLQRATYTQDINALATFNIRY